MSKPKTLRDEVIELLSDGTPRNISAITKKAKVTSQESRVRSVLFALADKDMASMHSDGRWALIGASKAERNTIGRQVQSHPSTNNQEPLLGTDYMARFLDALAQQYKNAPLVYRDIMHIKEFVERAGGAA